MTIGHLRCPICGASIPDRKYKNVYKQSFKCHFCKFQRLSGIGDFLSEPLSVAAIAPFPIGKGQLKIYSDPPPTQPATQKNPDEASDITLIPWGKHHRDLDYIFSDKNLVAVSDINGYFRAIFAALKPQGQLYLTTPIRRPLRPSRIITGQINVFTGKNIMFLLEQHGFKMVWRQNRFSRMLRLIARKC